ncbi:hypothetical protein CC80DRAFT_400759, partial [Byssothecium circinans]
ARPRILKFYPLYSPKLDREDFSRVKLMLHHPFQQVLDVRTFAGQEYQLFLQAYQNCLLVCNHPLPDSFGEVLPENEKEDPD